MNTLIHWPTARDFSEAIQNPAIVFTDPVLRKLIPSLDALGLPVLSSGNFATVCKMTGNGDSFAVRFFTRDPGDREERYKIISSHLEKKNIACLADFEYKPQEILIRGQRYPVIQMEWIYGPTLDSYIQQVLARPDVLKFLAEEVLALTLSLEQQGVAHGDLQHGNIITEGLQLRLVDLDGMYVPEMKGWKACEFGHPAYQHPKRPDSPFDEKVDRFSVLVIYLSLLALAERPGLWQAHHDDNLIFKRADFLSPLSSPLFNKLKAIKGEVGSITDALIRACLGSPSDVPALQDLVQKRSTLPGWMKAPVEVKVETKTREVPAGVRPDIPQPTPTATSSSSQPSAPTASSIPMRPPINLNEIYGTALGRMIQVAFFGVFFIWLWEPVLLSILKGAGIVSGHAKSGGWPLFFSYMGLCYLIALFWSWRAEVNKSQRSTQPSYLPSTTSYPSGSTYRPQTSIPRQRTSGTSVVASRIRTKYHRPGCRWARKIDPSNKMVYSSATDARNAGRRPCGECHPDW